MVVYKVDVLSFVPLSPENTASNLNPNLQELTNFGDGAHRKWNASVIIHAVQRLGLKLGGVRDALILSDDNQLVDDILVGAPPGFNFFSTNVAIAHAKHGQDCAREMGTGCDRSVSKVDRVEAAVFDFLLAGQCHHQRPRA